MTHRQQTPEQLAMIALAEGRNAFANLRASHADLLVALKQIADWEPSVSPSEPNGLSIIDAIDIARAAIAKAEGRR